jgi:acetyl-CoA acetyltransferase
MAAVLANRGLYSLLNLAISGSTDLRQAVFTGTMPAAGTIRDWNFLSDVIADASSAEAAASGYSRADLGSVTLTEVDASDNVTLTAAAPTYTAVAAGETWVFVAYYIEGASDAARTLVALDEPAATQVTNGSDITGPAFSLTVAQA